ncbi:DUF1853 family protein [Burkholderia pseudomallei]|uniref:Uncharacterized protein n=1 Tax=Burkholderia pseudomallei TaxID=28450 RepID=A0A2K9CLH5_BURPE|nr:DUF1853 family protein [Burkholderia pseudomallei]KGX73934.1 hypothetical protein Y033_1379 [Burkholderia pseudomallei MSHR435]AHE26649.1 hypothetical protein BBJ_657 [Burkholderia pseudomallei NCTC 13178]AIP04027.1 hypothetical protein DP51_3273 [Burkholderia pseudomallei]AIP72613.1 hypothetical protein DU27_1858 [Burkholderia pseudomallei]AIV79513.1 hypothetical protein X994_407 [Burkholderia pseudomallei]
MSAAASPVPPVALRDAAVRDLAWLLSSASLLAPSAGAPLAQPWASVADAARTAAWLAALDAQPAPLHDALAHARPVRLGRYAECLLGFFVGHAPSLRLVAANLPLRSNGRTLGECDFLIETARGERLHWELAVKCYLCVATAGTASLADFVGPNLADRFDLKRAKLIDHQLRLTTRDEFASLGHAGPWRAQMFVKGWLFYRADDGANAAGAVADPPEIGADHPRGFWITREAWPKFALAAARRDVAWIVLPRLAWLAPRAFDDADVACGRCVPLASDAVLDEVARQSGPSLVAALARDASGGWRETARGFIAPDDWPRRASAFAAR